MKQMNEYNKRKTDLNRTNEWLPMVGREVMGQEIKRYKSLCIK